MIDLCKFCGKQYRIQMYRFDCDDCNVEFSAAPDSYKRDPITNEVACIESKEYRSIRYIISDPDRIIGSMVMYLGSDWEIPNTTIWAPSSWNEDLQRYNPQPHWRYNNLIYPDTLPKDALALARRLMKINAFI